MSEKEGFKIRKLSRACRASAIAFSNVMEGRIASESERTLGIIVEDLTVFSSVSILEGIMDVCDSKGYSVVIENNRLFGRWSGEWLHNEELFQSALKPVIAKMNSLRLDGIIYVGGHEHTVKKLEFTNSIPVVMTYALAANKRIPTFRLDDFGGGHDAIQYLISMGHQKIGIIAAEYENTHTLNRILGCQQAFEEAGMNFDTALVKYGQWTKESGAKGMKELLDTGVTAVFCMSDIIATGAYEALFDKGLRPGRDISVLGYDNQPFAKYLTPGLTTMALPLREIGRSATEKIMEMIDDPDSTPGEIPDIRVKSTLLERESVLRLN